MKILLLLLLLSLTINSYAQQEEILEIRSNSPIDKDTFLIVDELPRFKGGEKRQAKFYKKTSKFDIAKSRENGCTVYFQMIIKEDGSITDLEILNNPSGILVYEVKRIVRLMPLWIPGKIDRKPVRVRVVQEISFSSIDQELSL